MRFLNIVWDYDKHGLYKQHDWDLGYRIFSYFVSYSFANWNKFQTQIMDNLRQPQLGKQKPFQYKKRNKTLFFSSLCLYSASHPFLLVLQWQHYVIGTITENMSINETQKTRRLVWILDYPILWFFITFQIE